MRSVRATASLFEQAAALFPGWTDAETGLRVLRIQTRGADGKAPVWSTPYHQHPCFLEGGRKVLLNGALRQGRRAGLVDLATGTVEDPLPLDRSVVEVNDRAHTATLYLREGTHTRACVWDIRAGRELSSVVSDDYWSVDIHLLSDGRRAVVCQHHGQRDSEPMHSRFLLLEPGAPPRQILEAQGEWPKDP